MSTVDKRVFDYFSLRSILRHSIYTACHKEVIFQEELVSS
jgi:hypothetical protein